MLSVGSANHCVSVPSKTYTRMQWYFIVPALDQRFINSHADALACAPGKPDN